MKRAVLSLLLAGGAVLVAAAVVQTNGWEMLVFLFGLLALPGLVVALYAVSTSQELEASRAAAWRFDDSWDEFTRELDRSRRHRRPFVLIRVPHPQSFGSASIVEGADVPDEMRWKEAMLFRRFLRSIDRIWVEARGVYILLPECERSEGEAFLNRLRRTAYYLLPNQGVGLIAYPEDGLTSGALLAALHEPLQVPAVAGVADRVPATVTLSELVRRETGIEHAASIAGRPEER